MSLYYNKKLSFFLLIIVGIISQNFLVTYSSHAMMGTHTPHILEGKDPYSSEVKRKIVQAFMANALTKRALTDLINQKHSFGNYVSWRQNVILGKKEKEEMSYMKQQSNAGDFVGLAIKRFKENVDSFDIKIENRSNKWQVTVSTTDSPIISNVMLYINKSIVSPNDTSTDITNNSGSSNVRNAKMVIEFPEENLQFISLEGIEEWVKLKKYKEGRVTSFYGIP